MLNVLTKAQKSPWTALLSSVTTASVLINVSDSIRNSNDKQM